MPKDYEGELKTLYAERDFLAGKLKDSSSCGKKVLRRQIDQVSRDILSVSEKIRANGRKLANE